MKKIFTLLFVSAFAFTSCSDDGAMGPQGPPGEDGVDAKTGMAIDLNPVDLTAENDYSLFFDFTGEGIEVNETDAILVYLKDGEDGEAGGEPVVVFRLLPQIYYVEDGQVQYNYDFTFFDVNIFMEGTANFDNLDAAYTEDQVFRIVVVPAGFAQTTGVNVSDMKAVMNSLDLDESEVKTMGNSTK